MIDMEAFIRGMPKAELHVHVEGTLEPELKFEIAERNGVRLAHRTVQQIRESYNFPDLASFLDCYFEGCDVLKTEHDFYDLMYRFLGKAFEENGVVYAEVMFDPEAHTRRGIPFEVAIDGLRQAQRDAQRDYGITSRLIMNFLRPETMEVHEETLRNALRFGDDIVGMGFDDDERGNPPVKFRSLMSQIRAEGFYVGFHCDLDQEDIVDHIWQCVRSAPVDRIDHGVNCLDDDDLADEIARRGIPLTVCPISTEDGKHSTVQRRRNPRFHRDIPVLLERGITFCLNSDDPAYFMGQYMNDILLTTQRAAGLNQEQMVRIMSNAFASSWDSENGKRANLARLESYSSEFGEKIHGQSGG